MKVIKLADLYEEDETAWLERTARLVRLGKHAEIDRKILAEYLTDMAKREKREVYHRLVVLIKHLLKQQHQPQRSSHGWVKTINTQRRHLQELLTSRTLKASARAVLAKAYRRAVVEAASETKLDQDAFPAKPAYTLDDLLKD